MRVLLDTNIYRQDFRLRSNAMRLLLDEAEREKIEILVPSVVFQETVRRFGEEVENLDSSLARDEKECNRLGLEVDILASARSRLEGQKDHYEQFLRATLETHNARFIEVPDVPHQQLLDRIISRRKPISEDGKRGYQDALIWETILHIQQSGSAKLYFITSNSSDFADASDRNRLAPDLVEDLALRCGDTECVALFSTLREFIDIHVKPSRELPEHAGEAIDGVPDRQSISPLLTGYLNGYAHELVGASPDAVRGQPLPLEELTITESEFSALTVQEMFRLSESEIGVSCMTEFRVTLRAYIDNDIDPAVLGSWIRQSQTDVDYARVQSKASLYVDMDLTFDQTRQAVVEAQPTFSWAEVDAVAPPPSNPGSRVGLGDSQEES